MSKDQQQYTIIPMTFDVFSQHLRDLIQCALRDGIPPEFMVMRLALNQQELGNMHIGLQLQKQRQEQEASKSPIVGVDGEPASN